MVSGPGRPISTQAADEPQLPAYGLRVAVLSGASQGSKASIGRSGIRIGSSAENDIVVSDPLVSRNHLELTPHPAGVRIRDLGSRNGTFLGGVRITDAVAPSGSLISIGKSELLVEPDQDAPNIPLADEHRLGALIGRSVAMRRLFTIITRAAPTDYTVLVEGATGTGKEVVARTIHELSPRRAGPLIVFDCASTTESLLESELFGHVRGAFTGAITAREGAFRRAQGGTLFIDEINSLPFPLQGKLLRALEARSVHPVGGDSDVEVDIRVVAASNQSLADEVAAKRFREDLFFRMSVIRVMLPALQDRREDIPLLAEHFLRSAGVEGEVAGANLDRLVGHSWPGNVRELRNVIERSLALAGSTRVSFADLPILIGDAAPTLAWPIVLAHPFKEAKDRLIDAFERLYLTHLLDRTSGNVSEAARSAQMSRRHLFDLLKKHNIAFRSEDDSET